MELEDIKKHWDVNAKSNGSMEFLITLMKYQIFL